MALERSCLLIFLKGRCRGYLFSPRNDNSLSPGSVHLNKSPLEKASLLFSKGSRDSKVNAEKRPLPGEPIDAFLGLFGIHRENYQSLLIPFGILRDSKRSLLKPWELSSMPLALVLHTLRGHEVPPRHGPGR